MKKVKLLNNNGFTLIEILLAIAVISIGMFAIMSSITAVMKGNAHSRKSTIATTLAMDKIEDLKRLGYNTVKGWPQTNIEGYGIDTANGESGYLSHKRVTTIFPDTPAANMLTGSITVFWISGPGTHSVNFTTILAK
ncbi:MAG: type IV pilus modification PilV family protein [Candidatus Anammoxibacter sp.]